MSRSELQGFEKVNIPVNFGVEYSCEWLLTWKRNNHAGFGKSENEYSNIPSFEKGQTGFEIM